MYFDVKGIAKSKGHLICNDAKIEHDTIIVHCIVNSKNSELAQYKALGMAVTRHAHENDYVPLEQEWDSKPEVVEMPPDKVNRILGQEIAPMLPGVD